MTSEEIRNRLWGGAEELRGSMDASRYKDYMLGLMFYKFLSDKTLETYRQAAGLPKMKESELLQSYTEARAKHGKKLDQMIQRLLGYNVLPEYLYQTWIRDINRGDFEVQKVTDSLNKFEMNIISTPSGSDFKGLFSSSTLDLSDTALGSNLHERSKNIKALIQLFADLNMINLQKGDVLGDAYEYLIGKFAMESGKKAGEFYTPRQVSEVMAQIVTKTPRITSIYDPTVGSGSLLLTVGRHLDEDARVTLNYYGQEKNTATYNLSRMNLLLHSIKPERITIRNADTLAEDWPEDPERPSEGILFDAVVMNPPYSVKNWNRADIKVSDPRFEIAGVLPPSSKGDYAFLLHGLYHLGQNGTMAIVLPHGVLFRGAAEGEIRKRLLEKNYIDTIIGLPANLFTNTGIPVVVMILKKNRSMDEPLLIIDASKSFIKAGKQNLLQEKDIAKIVDTYLHRKEIQGYSHLADRAEILENEYNLNIPRYIEYTDQEIPHDVDAHLYGGIPEANIKELKALEAMVPEVLKESLNPIRKGYVELIKPVDEIIEDALQAETVIEKTKEMETLIQEYVEKYWNQLKGSYATGEIREIMSSMLEEMKEQLSSFEFVDTYAGYQIVAELWKESLANDAELIAVNGFYETGRTRVPNMIIKGTGKNKRQEQDGWMGAVIPNGFISEQLFSHENQAIADLRDDLADVESQISEIVEAAKSEDTDENLALYDSLIKNEEDEPGDAFDQKSLKAELKSANRGSLEYKLLKRVDDLFSKKAKFAKDIKLKESELKAQIQDRIVNLTDEEIDSLIYKKWFGDFTDKFSSLLVEPIRRDLNTLKTLNDRYETTLDQIDEEIGELEKELEDLMSQLVVTYE